MLSRAIRLPALRGAAASLAPSATYNTVLPRVSQSLSQTRLLSQEVRTAISRAIESAPVVLFMKGTPDNPQCGFSRASVQMLGENGVDPEKFAAYNVLEDPELRSGIKEYSEWPTIPQLYIENEFIGGADIIMSMHKDGSLFDTLKSKGLAILADDEPKAS
ncbi:Grx4 family monothiol glutaredoxin [Cyphellophora europaea CBS 101466]|uniref:Monothiol glutaredoxin-5, mitochondrial n=1 Tax=Cyphellophora europaea (strain CBS 101466) TaxID=1220924 RepID=W2RIS9_CYPE1|nr:Grx4 family monothiol glutaredoxin [Cyphellophora europaea CBS 101466]ETN36377.1 Grx4 family monothiol glutaredoxin [Cyphellophora europaea CBS 101466]